LPVALRFDPAGAAAGCDADYRVEDGSVAKLAEEIRAGSARQKTAEKIGDRLDIDMVPPP